MKTIVVVGPTASGKTALAIELAQRYNGEIICADSRTIYEGLTIGTAKPSFNERRAVQHYGLDLLNPNQRYSAMQFKDYCSKAVQRIVDAHKTPIIVGGSGLYIDAYVFNYQPPKIDITKVRDYEKASITELQQMIKDRQLTMPNNYKNKLHLIHTIVRDGEQPLKDTSALENIILVGINPPRLELKQRISERVRQMIAAGVVQEAKVTFKQYGYTAPGVQGGIYKQLALYDQGLINIDMVISQTITSDLQLAKRQMTWFKRNPAIQWFETAQQARIWLDKYIQGTL